MLVGTSTVTPANNAFLHCGNLLLNSLHLRHGTSSEIMCVFKILLARIRKHSRVVLVRKIRADEKHSGVELRDSRATCELLENCEA